MQLGTGLPQAHPGLAACCFLPVALAPQIRGIPNILLLPPQPAQLSLPLKSSALSFPTQPRRAAPSLSLVSHIFGAKRKLESVVKGWEGWDGYLGWAAREKQGKGSMEKWGSVVVGWGDE